MKHVSIAGYCDRPNVKPGEKLSFYVSCKDKGQSYSASLVRMVNGDPNPQGPGVTEYQLPSNIDGVYSGFPQWTTTGAFVHVPDPEGTLDLAKGGTVHLFMLATTPGLPHTVIGRWDEATKTGWTLQVTDGRLELIVGDGKTTQSVSSGKRLFTEIWYSVMATVDVKAGTLSISQRTKINRVNSRMGLESIPNQV